MDKKTIVFTQVTDYIETDFIVGGLEYLHRLHQFLHKAPTELIENTVKQDFEKIRFATYFERCWVIAIIETMSSIAPTMKPVD